MPLWKRNLVVVWFGSFLTAAALSLVLPFLPLFIEELGVDSRQDITTWSGIAFGATFLVAAIVSPIWGRLADRSKRTEIDVASRKSWYVDRHVLD